MRNVSLKDVLLTALESGHHGQLAHVKIEFTLESSLLHKINPMEETTVKQMINTLESELVNHLVAIQDQFVTQLKIVSIHLPVLKISASSTRLMDNPIVTGPNVSNVMITVSVLILILVTTSKDASISHLTVTITTLVPTTSVATPLDATMKTSLAK